MHAGFFRMSGTSAEEEMKCMCVFVYGRGVTILTHVELP